MEDIYNGFKRSTLAALQLYMIAVRYIKILSNYIRVMVFSSWRPFVRNMGSPVIILPQCFHL